MTAIGQYRQRVTFEEDQGTANAMGEIVPSWVATHTAWAKVIPKEAREFAGFSQTEAEVDYAIKMRWQSGITTEHRITWDGKVLDIQGIQNPDQRKCEMLILARDRNA